MKQANTSARHGRIVRKSLLALAGLFALTGAQARAELLYATNGSTIARFDSATPGTVTSVAVTGLQTSETLVSIDLRPATGTLYALGSTSRVYVVNPTTGVATSVGAFTPALSGANIGMDFNPTVDRIRQTSNTGQNQRLNPTDGSLTATDTAISPATVTISDTAYTNNFAGATTTTLYDIDYTAGTLGTIANPNTGAVATVGSLGLGTNLNAGIGFDISGGTGVAFASILTGGVDRLYTINLSTGAATLVNTIGAGTTTYFGLTSSTIPEPSTYALCGLGLAALAVGWMRRRSTAGAAA